MPLSYDFTKTTESQQQAFGSAIAKFIGLDDKTLCEVVAAMPKESPIAPYEESAKLFGRHYLHNVLPWKLMFSDMQELDGDDDKCAEEFIWRMMFLEKTAECGYFPGINSEGVAKRFMPTRDMLRGVNINANVCRETRKQFIKDRLSRITQVIDGRHKTVLREGELIKTD